MGESGIEGRTMVDGGCPVEYEASPCPAKPISAEITASAGGRVIARVTSDADGRFRISLPPGSYVVHAINLSGGLYPRSAPVNVTVRSGRYTAVAVSFDSGIQ